MADTQKQPWIDQLKILDQTNQCHSPPLWVGLVNTKNPPKSLPFLSSFFCISFKGVRCFTGLAPVEVQTKTSTKNSKLTCHPPNGASIPSMTRPSTTCFPFNLLWSPQSRSSLGRCGVSTGIPPRSKTHRFLLGWMVLLMAEILHQCIGSLSHYL